MMVWFGSSSFALQNESVAEKELGVNAKETTRSVVPHWERRAIWAAPAELQAIGERGA